MTAGQVAEELLELLELEFDKLDPVGQRIVANRLLERLSAWLPEPKPLPPVEPMTEQQAKAYGLSALDFGKHAGEELRDVPVDYLEWLADASRDLWRNLHGYLHRKKGM
jgi:hypothetical protein